MKKKVILIAIVATLILVILILAANSIGTSAKTERTAENTRFMSYEIRTNDSLWSIASQYAPAYGVSAKTYVDELKRVNGLQGDRIVAGTHLIVLYPAN